MKWTGFYCGDQVHASFETVLNNLDRHAEGLAAANGLFQQQGAFEVSETYRRALDEYYDAAVQPLNFRGQPLQAMEYINAWARNGTHGKVERLLRRPLDPHTQLVLVNALTFRSQWLYAFDARLTFDKGLFYTTSYKRFEIPMMVGRVKIPVGYSTDLECRIAELPFASRRVSLFVVLPDDVDRGLAKLEQSMSSDNIKALFSTLKVRNLNESVDTYRRNNRISVMKKKVRNFSTVKNLCGRKRSAVIV